jgi:hypothetical protein
MPISRFIPFALLTLFFSSIAYADVTEETFNTLLDSDSLSEQREAFNKITTSPEQYVPLVRNRLTALASGQLKPNVKSIDRLFYLAAFLKDKSLAAPMEALWRDTSFLPNYCLYWCPMIFALTVYATSDLWTPPDNMNKSLPRYYDLYSEIRIASEISLEPIPLEQLKQKIMGIDRYLEEASKKSERQLIYQAGRQTEDFKEREAAIFQLMYSVSSSKNLEDLYWLAIQEGKPDAGFEFKRALYRAIYRAEKANRRGQ